MNNIEISNNFQIAFQEFSTVLKALISSQKISHEDRLNALRDRFWYLRNLAGVLNRHYGLGLHPARIIDFYTQSYEANQDHALAKSTLNGAMARNRNSVAAAFLVFLEANLAFYDKKGYTKANLIKFNKSGESLYKIIKVANATQETPAIINGPGGSYLLNYSSPELETEVQCGISRPEPILEILSIVTRLLSTRNLEFLLKNRIFILEPTVSFMFKYMPFIPSAAYHLSVRESVDELDGEEQKALGDESMSSSALYEKVIIICETVLEMPIMEAVRCVIHELGHAFYYEVMSQSQRFTYEEYHSKLTTEFATEYSAKAPTEDFAEIWSLLITQMPYIKYSMCKKCSKYFRDSNEKSVSCNHCGAFQGTLSDEIIESRKNIKWGLSRDSYNRFINVMKMRPKTERFLPYIKNPNDSESQK